MTERVSVETRRPRTDALDLRSGALRLHSAETLLLRAWEQHERWAVDLSPASAGPALALYLDGLAALVTAAAPMLHQLPRDLAQQLAYLSSARCLAVLRYIAQHNTQFLDSLALLIEADGGNDPVLAALGARIEAFSRARLLGEIFSGKRLHRIQTIMESYTDE